MALVTNIRKGLQVLTGTSTQAYLASSSVTKKMVYNIVNVAKLFSLSPMLRLYK